MVCRFIIPHYSFKIHRDIYLERLLQILSVFSLVIPSQALLHQAHSPGEKHIGKPQEFPLAELFRELVLKLNDKMYDFGEWPRVGV